MHADHRQCLVVLGYANRYRTGVGCRERPRLMEHQMLNFIHELPADRKIDRFDNLVLPVRDACIGNGDVANSLQRKSIL